MSVASKEWQRSTTPFLDPPILPYICTWTFLTLALNQQKLQHFLHNKHLYKIYHCSFDHLGFSTSIVNNLVMPLPHAIFEICIKIRVKKLGGTFWVACSSKFQLLHGRAPNTKHKAWPPVRMFKNSYKLPYFCVWATFLEWGMTPPPNTVYLESTNKLACVGNWSK